MTTATRFMRIPFFVTGFRVTKDNMDAIAKWCEGHVIDSEHPFVRVPVNRPTNKKQTEAYVGTWVILSTQRGERSFKVYTEEWLRKQFFELPEDSLDEGIPESLEEAPRRQGNVHAIPTPRAKNSSSTVRAANA